MITRAHCEDCQATRKAERTPPNHILHLLVTVAGLALGMFLHPLWFALAFVGGFIWLVAAMSAEPYRCSVCGSDRLKFHP